MWRVAPAISPFAFLKRAGRGHATVLDLTEPMLVEGRKRAEAEQTGRKPGLGGGRRHGVALRGQHIRRLHHQFRHPERDPPRKRPCAKPTAC